MGEGRGLGAGELFAERYRIERMIGEGGFGAVYRARQLDLDRVVALKLLHRDQGEDRAREERFIREAHLIRDLEHPHIVRLHDYGKSPDGRLFIALQYLEGEALDDRLDRSGALSVQQCAHIAAQVLRALMEAHRHGIIHRDIKPSNIFLCQYSGSPDFVKLLDFGLAKPVFAKAEGPDKITVQGQLVGTPIYMAPEQILGEGLGAGTDLYALGLVMSEMLTGQTVYRGDSLMHIYAQQLSSQAVPLPEAVRSSPLGPIITQATAKQASARFESAAAMLQALEAASAQGGWSITAPHQDFLDVPRPAPRDTSSRAFEQTTDSAAVTPPPVAPPRPARPAREVPAPEAPARAPAARRGPGAAVWALAVAGLLVVGGGGAALFWALAVEPAPEPVEPPRPVIKPTSAEEVEAPSSAPVARRARRRAAPHHPVPGDPTRFAPLDYLEQASALAREREGDAQLVQAQLDHVTPSGVIDLKAPGGRALYRFRSPARSRGGGGECLVEVRVDAEGATVRLVRSGSCAEPLAAAPRCTPVEIWRKARQGDPNANHAHADLVVFHREWLFKTGMDESIMTIPDSCD